MKVVTSIQMAMMFLLASLASAQGVGSIYDGPRVTIEYVHGYVGADQVQMDELIRRFNDSHTNITVNAQGVPWGTTWAQLGNLVAAGRAPDVIAMTEDVITSFAARGALVELSTDAVADMGVDSSAYYANLWDGSRWNGALYGIPLSSSAMVMYFNRDLMDRFGITDVPTNRDAFLEAATACTTDTRGRHPGDEGFDASRLDTYGVGVTLPWIGGTFAYGVLRSNGGDLVDAEGNADFDSRAAVEAVQFLVGLVYEHQVSPERLSETNDVNSFRAGRSCFNFSGVWQITGYNEAEGLNYGIAFQPQLGTAKPAAWGAAVWMVLPRQRGNYDPNKLEASKEFVRWMTAAEQNLYWTTSGALPTQPIVAEDERYADNPMQAIAANLDALYIPTGYPWIPQVRNAWDAALEQALLSSSGVEEALAGGVREAEQQIEEAKQSLGLD
jgi:multiple sugar transport system substrate-binding protein